MKSSASFLMLLLLSGCVYASGNNLMPNDPLMNYDPEDYIMVDENGKVIIIEDDELKEKHTDKGSRVCMEITLDGGYSRYDIKKCETDP